MMINWAEKQAQKDRQATGRIVMTQYGVEEPRRSFVESEDENEPNRTT